MEIYKIHRHTINYIKFLSFWKDIDLKILAIISLLGNIGPICYLINLATNWDFQTMVVTVYVLSYHGFYSSCNVIPLW